VRIKGDPSMKTMKGKTAGSTDVIFFGKMEDVGK